MGIETVAEAPLNLRGVRHVPVKALAIGKTLEFCDGLPAIPFRKQFSLRGALELHRNPTAKRIPSSHLAVDYAIRWNVLRFVISIQFQLDPALEFRQCKVPCYHESLA